MKHAEHGDPTHQSWCGTIAIAQIPGTPQVASQTISRSRAPLIGEHTSDILAELGVSKDHIEAMLTDKAPASVAQ